MEILGWLNVITGAIELAVCGAAVLIMLAFIPVVNASDYLGGLALTGCALLVTGVALAVPAPKIIAGIGLLQRRPWARILAAVLAVLGFVSFPLGTLVSIYAFWVLLSPGTDQIMTAAA